MKKWILIGGGAFVVIIGIVIVVGVSNLGPMIKSAVNTYGPEMTKTEVRLGDVDISLFSAEAELKSFFLGNPKGFRSPQAMNVGSIFVNIDEKSLTGNTIIIDRIEVVAPEITHEKIGRTDNFQTILNNVKKAVGADKTPQTSAKKGKADEGKKILIKNFIVRDGKVTLDMPILKGKTITTKLPDIHLKDVGKEKGGATPADAFKEIFGALYAKITSPEVTDVFNKGLGGLTTGTQTVTERAKEGVKTATDKIKGLFGN